MNSKHTWIGILKSDKIPLWFCVDTSIANSDDNTLKQKENIKFNILGSIIDHWMPNIYLIFICNDVPVLTCIVWVIAIILSVSD